MDEIIGKDADDDTIFGKKSTKKRSGKGLDSFFSIAMAKVATLHWLNATGKASLPAPYLWLCYVASCYVMLCALWHPVMYSIPLT